VPVNPVDPIEVVAVEHGYKSIAAKIGGPCTYIERFRCPLTSIHGLVGVCDEDGQRNGQPQNMRAWPLYPVQGYTLRGDVLVMQEGMTPEGPDFVDMTAERAEVALNLVVGLVEGAYR
jgi:hypothetical protein